MRKWLRRQFTILILSQVPTKLYIWLLIKRVACCLEEGLHHLKEVPGLQENKRDSLKAPESVTYWSASASSVSTIYLYLSIFFFVSCNLFIYCQLLCISLVLTLLPSSGIFVHFSQLFFFFFVAVLSLWNGFLQELVFLVQFFFNPVSFTLTCPLFSCNAFCTLWPPSSPKMYTHKICYKILIHPHPLTYSCFCPLISMFPDQNDQIFNHFQDLNPSNAIFIIWITNYP